MALGALIGKSEYQLEVLKDSNPAAVEEGKRFIDEKRIQISLKDNIEEKLYIEVCCEAGKDKATAIIAGGHTTFIYIARNEEVLLNKQTAAAGTEEKENTLELSLRKVYDFALTAPLDEIRFILETARLNKAAAERSFQGDYGHGLGKILRGSYEHKILGDSIFSHILSYTSGACDARMAGAMIPVMSNSGSGNQGISATLPVLVYAEENGKSEEELIRALMMSHLTVIYICLLYTSGAEHLFHVVGITVAFRTVYVKRPLTGFPMEGATAYVQPVERRAGHKADGLNAEIFHL